MAMRFQRAFTLIELMLALMIAAILTSLAYPAYIDHETQAERLRAEVALMQLAAQLEVYFSDNNSYDGATIHSLHVAMLMQGLDYRLKIAKASDMHYLIRAIPKNSQAERDTDCEILSLSDTNKRGISGDGSVNACWR
ncbi:MAG: hypothetical protein A3E82_04570 [Gammaproteobacteria bacterium RIFCSPHIGHO2_12_FULL_38_11]|nr:MAG: hypothetical protein A3E82_04570 [Gammaproteobacteria bacterium RIFCSPHIGHO2_12_FULL_38_11]